MSTQPEDTKNENRASGRNRDAANISSSAKGTKGAAPSVNGAANPLRAQPTRQRHNGSSKIVDSTAAMLAKLKLSGLEVEDARALGMVPCTARDATALGLSKHYAGFKIPYFDLNGRQTDFFRYRFLEPTKTGWDAVTDKKEQRYTQPVGSVNELYLPPLMKGTNWRTIANNSDRWLVITEGELKAACATKHGIRTIGLGGVWNFKSKDAPLLPLFEEFEWDGRTVYICYDSDAATNPKVGQAERALARELARLGAQPKVIRIPPDGDKKVGLDDYLVAKGVEAFQSLMEEAAECHDADPFSDKGNAYRMVTHVGRQLIHAPGLGWLAWDGARWNPSQSAAQNMFYALGPIIRREAADTDDDEQGAALRKHARRSENAGKIKAAMELTAPLLERDAALFDADSYLLGCNNGTVNLRTGTLTPPDADLLITKSTGHAYDPDAKCPTWERFLERIFRKHPELLPFMQRLAGYWLTGLTDPPYLSVLYGVGANGKSTLVNAIMHAMGDYAGAAPPKLLMMKYGQHHPTELAALQGMRLVVAAESGDGGRLDEERIKALTGSDAITARRMREDFYTFTPTHKLALMTNHKPIVRGTDEGIWRRLRLVPFDEIIPEKERDRNLSAKLRAEAPGILAWMVAGAQAFLKNDLPLPQIVTDATLAYRAESDVIGAFIDDECDLSASAQVSSAQLYAVYERWCEENGEQHPLPKRTLGLRLQDRGITGVKGARGVRLLRGIALKTPAKF